MEGISGRGEENDWNATEMGGMGEWVEGEGNDGKGGMRWKCKVKGLGGRRKEEVEGENTGGSCMEWVEKAGIVWKEDGMCGREKEQVEGEKMGVGGRKWVKERGNRWMKDEMGGRRNKCMEGKGN